MKAILFDLDGTLLPMSQDAFTEFYLPALSRKMAGQGFDPEVFVKALWSGMAAMIQNNGPDTNEVAFWKTFEQFFPNGKEKAELICLDFYQNEFNETIQVTRPTPLSRQVVEAAREKGYQIYLATNPIFPRCATVNRVRWAGLTEEDFLDITTFEHCHYCKPNPKYFEELMDKHNLKPEDCLMVGNDVADDLAAGQLGITTYLVTDTMENRKNQTLDAADYIGTMEELLAFIQKA